LSPEGLPTKLYNIESYENDNEKSKRIEDKKYVEKAVNIIKKNEEVSHYATLSYV